MKEALEAFVKRVKDLAAHVKGNEQATKQSLIAPLFALLGYDLSDPRECMPEYKVDFGKERSNKPIDWAFFQNGRPIFFVEAKEVGKKLASYDEQLGDYFAKSTDAKLGILTNGITWRFYTDLEHTNVMDKEPFIKWDVLSDDQTPPVDFLTLMQKPTYNSQLVRTFAERKRAQNLLINELCRLLEPSPEFTKLAIANIETRNLKESVVDSWKPIVANAINEWANQRMLSSVLNPQSSNEAAGEQPEDGSKPAKGETTQEELDAFAIISRILGNDKKIAFQDTATYFKIHLPERHTWVVCRLYLSRKRPLIWFPLETPKLQALYPGFEFTTPEPSWSCLKLEGSIDFEKFAEAFRASWEEMRRQHPVS